MGERTPEVMETVRFLLREGLVRHITVLMLLHYLKELAMSDLRHALAARPGKRAGYREVYAVTRELMEMGLLEERVVGRYGKRKIRIYRLTEKGAKVAAILVELLDFKPPEGH